jgi:hypothetical protein
MTRRIFVLLFLMGASLFARDAKEDARIDALLKGIASLEGATFVRNGEEHRAKDAADHLRSKLERSGERVKTAEDFIDGCATKSSVTGKPYKIRFADGVEKESGPYLHGELRKIDAATK